MLATSMHATLCCTDLDKRGVLVHLIIPIGYIFEAFPIGDVVYDDDAVSVAIVAVGDGSEALLACGVPLIHI